MQIGSAHDPFLRAVNYANRSPICQSWEEKKRNGETALNSRTLVVVVVVVGGNVRIPSSSTTELCFPYR